MAAHADAVVIGSAIVRTVAAKGDIAGQIKTLSSALSAA
jgi:tryptophan synthase alpha subunit